MRPWVPRAIVMAALHGLVQALFVALRARVPDLTTVWTLLLLGLLVGVGLLWGGVEVVLDRRPPEWTWFRAALASAPAAGLLTWILLALFVDNTGPADLGSALVGRAAFTALLVLASVTVGSRLGWLSLRRRGGGAADPTLDADDEAVSREAAQERVPIAPAGPPRPAGGPTVAGVRTPGFRGGSSPETCPARPPAPASRPGPSPTRPAPPTPTTRRGEGLEPPQVAVLPTSELPSDPAGDPATPGSTGPGGAPEDEEPSPRRRFGLRRPGS